MSVTKRTETQLAGTGLSEQHGEGSGGNRGYINEIIDQINTNETAIAANAAAIAAMDTPAEFEYTPGDATDWPGTAPTQMQAALDNLAAYHPRIEALVAAVDIAATGNNALTLPGNASKYFVPRELVVICKTATALNGDAVISLGTSAGGKEIMTDLTLTGLNTVGESFRFSLEGPFPAIAGNAALDCTVETADTGTSGTVDVRIIGEQF